MSFSLYVIPTEKEPLSFAMFKQCWLGMLAVNPELALEEDIGIYSYRTEGDLKDDDLLEIGANFSFRHSANRLLTLSLLPRTKSFIDDEREYLDYYAQQGLEANEVAMLAEKWRQAGYAFTLTSYVGRHEKETAFMCVVAMALAKCTNGRVLVTEWRVFHRNGIFTPEQFKENLRFIDNMG